MESSSTDSDRDPVVTVSESQLVYQSSFIGRPSGAVIEAIETLERTAFDDLPVVYKVIDLDSLDSLYQNPSQMRFPAEVSFSVGTYRFFLSSESFIQVYDLSEADDT